MAANWGTDEALNDKPELGYFRPGQFVPITFIRQGKLNTNVPDHGLDSFKNCCADSGNERNQSFASNGSRQLVPQLLSAARRRA